MQVTGDAVLVPGREDAAATARPLTRQALIWAASLAGLVFTIVACSTSRLFMLDTFASLASGRLISANGVPHIETMTWAAHGRPWIDQQWLGQWLYYQAYRIGGYPAVGALSAVCIALAFGLLAAFMLRRGTSPVRTLIWVAIAYAVCELNTIVRTQSFAYPLFVLTIVILLEDDRRKAFNRSLLALPLVFLLWANLHGSALLTAPIVVVYCLWAASHNRRRDQRRSLASYLGLAACMPIALLATPYGLTIVDYYRSVLDNPVIAARVGEWKSATFGGPSTQFVILLLATIAVIGFAYGRGFRPSPFLVFVTCTLAAAGIHTVRYQVWFALVATLLVAEVMSGTTAAAESPLIQRIASRLVPAAAVIGVVGSTLLLVTTSTARFEALTPAPRLTPPLAGLPSTRRRRSWPATPLPPPCCGCTPSWPDASASTRATRCTRRASCWLTPTGWPATAVARSGRASSPATTRCCSRTPTASRSSAACAPCPAGTRSTPMPTARCSPARRPRRSVRR